ncbi:hypothetical protein NW752_005924 [Fusarium irregulare]|nr:hypothetical protein NW752_005924 [Fusarium irregulare]
MSSQEVEVVDSVHVDLPRTNEPRVTTKKQNGVTDKVKIPSVVEDLTGEPINDEKPAEEDQAPIMKEEPGPDSTSDTQGMTSDAPKPIVDDPAAVEPASDEEEDVLQGNGFFAKEKFIEVASGLTTEDLYGLYANKMKALRDTQKIPAPRRPSKFVNSIVDYVQVLEERIGKLEEAVDVAKAKPENADAVATEDADKATGTGDGEEKDKDQTFEAKFFHSATEFNREGKHKPDKSKDGTFSCDSDSQHFIRVLFNWTDGRVQSQPAKDSQPDPEKVDIIALRIESEPVSEFLKATVNLSTNLFPSLRMKKPFRPLLQSYDKIKEQLAKLDRWYNLPQIESKTERSFALPSDTSIFPEQAIYEKADALAHFQALVSFLDKYLAKQVNYFDRIKRGEEVKISFENLWMLYEAGVPIYCASRDAKRIGDYSSRPQYVDQAFRVMGALGGVPSTLSFAPDVEDSINLGDEIGESDVSSTKVDSRTLGSTSKRMYSLFSSLYVLCFNIDFDGMKYGVVEHVFVFKPFHGQIDIQKLEAYPRGEMFIDTTLVSHLAYEGLSVGNNREEVESDIIVDFKLAYTENHANSLDANTVAPRFDDVQSFPTQSCTETLNELSTISCGSTNCTTESCGVDAFFTSQNSQADKIKEEIQQQLDECEPNNLSKESLRVFKDAMKELGLLQLLPGVVPGFALRNKAWVLLNIRLLKEPERTDEWHQLELPDGHKEMVQAMVETYAKGSNEWSSAPRNQSAHAGMDIVRGKGKGCIILLHGVPGVGKTSTAECVAAYTGRPLYPIACGDIGYAPEKVEENMEKHFRLAHKWGCVLLLDEADVFLAKRMKADVKRNGLVSVFLRIMEYYSGILFLTTNRVGAIDDAFRSRLHLTLYYPRLSEKQTKKIWSNNIKRLKGINKKQKEDKSLRTKFESEEIMDWVNLNWEVLQWNGRQIRNAFQTALAMTEFEAKHSENPEAKRTLTVKHFHKIADATMRFNEYLVATHGADEDTTAGRDKLRTERFSPSIKLKELPKPVYVSSEEDSEESVSEDSDDSSSKKRKKNSKAKAKSKSTKKSKKEENRGKSNTKKNGSKEESESESDSDSEDRSEAESREEVAGKKRKQ